MPTSELASSIEISTGEPAQPRKRGNVLGGLQVLRAVAALLVLLTHGGFYASERLEPGYKYWEGGAVGVSIFFVISGFVMIHSSRSLFSNSDGWKIFAERRVVRIVPLYWLALTVKLIPMVLASGLVLHAKLAPEQVILSYFFLPTWNPDHELRPLLGVGWTLNFEMFFYFMFCVVLALRGNVIVILSVLFSGLAIASYFHAQTGPAAVFYLDPIVLNFVWGMLIAHFYSPKKLMNWKIAAAGFVIGFVGILVPSQALITGLAAALIIWSAVQLEPKLQWLPAWALFLGDASYAIYLFHPMIAPLAPVVLLKLHLHIVYISIFLSVCLGFGAGSIIHRFAELPMTRFFRDRIRLRGKAVIHMPESTISK